MTTRHKIPPNHTFGSFQSDPGHCRFGAFATQHYQSSLSVHVVYSDGAHGTFVCSALSPSAHIDPTSAGGGYVEDVENLTGIDLFLDTENDPMLGP